MTHFWPWGALALLGAYHGLNPAMGWLFALALGLQEQRRQAVLIALIPIALGHAAAIALALLLLQFALHFISAAALKWGVAILLFGLGAYRLFRAGHPRGAGMRVTRWELGVWSFLMASAHGAGLMVLPVLLAGPGEQMHHAHNGMFGPAATPMSGAMSTSASSAGASSLSPTLLAMAVLVHTTAMLVVAGVLALGFFEFYEQSGLQFLRRAWVNFDLIWAIALIVAAVSVILL